MDQHNSTSHDLLATRKVGKIDGRRCRSIILVTGEMGLADLCGPIYWGYVEHHDSGVVYTKKQKNARDR